jgi:hypothetical protein
MVASYTTTIKKIHLLEDYAAGNIHRLKARLNIPVKGIERHKLRYSKSSEISNYPLIFSNFLQQA